MRPLFVSSILGRNGAQNQPIKNVCSIEVRQGMKLGLANLQFFILYFFYFRIFQKYMSNKLFCRIGILPPFELVLKGYPRLKWQKTITAVAAPRPHQNHKP